MSDWRDETAAYVKEKKAGSSYTMDVGENAFRILPNKKGAKLKPYIPFRLHRNVGPDQTWVRCGKTFTAEKGWSGSCWLCDKQIPALEASESEDKRAMAKAMKVKENIMFQVSPVDSAGRFGMPKSWWAPANGGKSIGVKVLGKLANLKMGAIDDPKTGRNLTVERTGQKLKTDYDGPAVDDEPSVVPQRVLDAMKTLEELLPAYDAKRQFAAWKGEKFEGGRSAPVAVVEPESDNAADYELDEPEVAESSIDEGELPEDDFDTETPPDDEPELEPEADPDTEGEELEPELEAEFEPEPEPVPVRRAPARGPVPVPTRTAPRPAAAAAAAAPSRGTSAHPPAPATRPAATRPATGKPPVRPKR